jgi:site-specific recombinase XerD
VACWSEAPQREDLRLARTTNRCLTTLKRIFNYADAKGLRVPNPVRRVKYLKESRERMRVLSVEEIQKYLEHAKGNQKDFADAPFVLYDFRHTFARRCVQSGVELPVLAGLLGHSDLTTTMRYVHPAAKVKRDAVERLEKFVKLTRDFEAILGPVEDEWGVPVSTEEPTQKPSQLPELGDVPF